MKQLSPIQLQQQIIHYKSELYKYQQKCRELEGSTAIKQLSALQHELSSLKSENKTLLHTASQWENRYREAIEISVQQASALKRMQSAYHKLQTKLSLVKEQVQKQKNKDDSIRASDEQCMITVNAFLKKSQKFEDALSEARVTMEFLNDERSRLNEKIKGLEKTIYLIELDLYETYLKAEADRQLHKDALEHINMKTAAIAKENEMLHIQRATFTDQLHKEYEKYSEERKKVMELERKVDKEQHMRKELAATLKQFRKKIDQWKEIMKFDINGEGSGRNEIPFSEKQAYEKEIKRLKNTNADLIEEINHLKKK
ncbi:hypothetical protein ACQ0QQ_15940 [Lysinibacillus sphaericus]